MKIPEKAPDWRKVYKGLSAEKRVSDRFDLRDEIKKANNKYIYWDKAKYLHMPEGFKPEEVWALIKNIRQGDTHGLPLNDLQNNIFTYWTPAIAQKYLHLIDRGMEKVISTALKGETAKEYQLRSIMEEAIASSQIEGAATTRAVAKEMLRTKRKPRDYDEKMILNNHLTISKLKEYADKPLSPELIKEIHASITKDTLEESSEAGVFRTEQNEVQDLDNKVLHVPPPPKKVEYMVKVMCYFANNNDDEFIHPVIKGIILHFWLSYVHPFMDGNGRTARALFYWYMLRHDYPLIEYLSISSVINKKRTQYLKAFLYSEMDDNDMTYFIMFHLKAIQEALDDVVEYIKRKKSEAELVDHLYARLPTLNHRQWPIIFSALGKPDEKYTVEKHMNTHGTARQTARTDLLELHELGLLDMRKEGRKFVFTPVADLAEKLKPE